MIEDLSRALDALQRGLVVATATETFFGLLADASQPSALERVLALKGRDAAKGIALLLPNREAWITLVTEIPPLAKLLADRFWPGPLTIALPAQSHVDARLTVGGTVAVRWPADSDAARLARAFGRPLTATSANPAGKPPCTTSEEVAIALTLGAEELVIVPGRAPGGAPSTLVNVSADRVTIVREGHVSKRDVAAVVPGGALG